MLKKKFKNSNRNYFSCISNYDNYIIDISNNINTSTNTHRTICKCKQSKIGNKEKSNCRMVRIKVIRRANEKDIPRLMELLEQVLQIHADIRPDIFIPGTTKYTEDELKEMLKDDTKPVYVAADENDVCLGYAFCQLKQQPFSNNMVPFTSLFIDDLCVDAKTRGQHVGESLFEYVKGEAKRLGCYEVTLNVWAGNTSAEKFYEKMGLKTKERQMEYIL